MIGPYSQFKGKLKAGDRVRVEYGGRTSLGEVNETSESGFTVRENMDEWRCVERFIFWTSEGTLELLTPSPRVVTLENLEPGDEVRQDKIKMTVDDVGGFKKLIVLLDPSGNHNVWTAEDLKKWGWQPVQPASPPAPAEKEEEWWEGHFNRHFPNPEDSWIKTWAHFLVDEAKRRGAEEAWKEAKCIIEAQKKYRGIISTAGGDFILLVRLVEAIDAKLESLNKPAGAGEK